MINQETIMPRHRPIKIKEIDNVFLQKQLMVIARKEKIKSITGAFLVLAAMGGILGLSIAAPGSLKLLNILSSNSKKEKYRRYQEMWQAFYRLKKKRLLEFVKEEEDGTLVYQLTKRGRQKVKKFIIDELSIAHPKKWNKEWHLVLFDIPEKHRVARDALRKKLREMDFYQCQKSAWIHPFPCIEEIEFLKDYFQIKPYVRIFTIKEIDDGRILYYFKDLLKKYI